MGFPDFQLALTLDTDASHTGIGAVLSQVQDGIERVIAYVSQFVTKVERRYSVTRLEMLTSVITCWEGILCSGPIIAV